MALARALAIEPKVLLLDEPFGALDAQVRQQLRLWLRDLHDTISVTTVLVTHDQEEAMEVADHLAIINEGRLEQVGHPAEMYDHPANEFVIKFLGPATRLDGEWVRPHDLVVHRDPAVGDHAGHGGAGHPPRVRGAGGRGHGRRRCRLGPAQPRRGQRARPRPPATGCGCSGRRLPAARRDRAVVGTVHTAPVRTDDVPVIPAAARGDDSFKGLGPGRSRRVGRRLRTARRSAIGTR